MQKLNAGAALTTSNQTLIDVPVGKFAQIVMMQVSNVDVDNPADVTVQWTDASNSDAVIRLCGSSVVPPKDARSVQAGGMILKAGDTLVASASADDYLEITVSYLLGDA